MMGAVNQESGEWAGGGDELRRWSLRPAEICVVSGDEFDYSSADFEKSFRGTRESCRRPSHRDTCV
jgi:hypothetical protein